MSCFFSIPEKLYIVNMTHIRNYHLRTERWRDVKGYKGLYQVSNFGRVKSLDRYVKFKDTVSFKKGCYISSSSIGKYKHQHIVLYKDNSAKWFTVHRLVAQAFIPNPDNKPCIDHKDTNPLNNCVWNLHWVTKKENNNNPLTKIKMSVSHKGKKMGKEHHKSKPVQQLTLTNIPMTIYDSIGEAQRGTGVGIGNIWSCCVGRRKSAGGYKWQYV